jgi:hypothetical protein
MFLMANSWLLLWYCWWLIVSNGQIRWWELFMMVSSWWCSGIFYGQFLLIVKFVYGRFSDG